MPTPKLHRSALDEVLIPRVLPNHEDDPRRQCANARALCGAQAIGRSAQVRRP